MTTDGDWKEGWGELTKKTHRDQAKWFLNAFWNDGGEENAEKIWQVAHSFVELDVDQPILYGKKAQELKEGCDLDPHKSQRILEILDETMTVLELRKRLKKLDIDNNKRMSISEYLLDKYEKTPFDLVNTAQGTIDQDVLDEATDKVNNAQNSLELALQAKKKCDEAEAPLKKATEELEQIVGEIEKMEKEKADKIAKLDQKICNKKNSTVTIGRAKAEREQLASEDPLPMQKAKINQGAKLKRVKKARKPFKKATEAAEACQSEAEAAFQEASDFLENLKNEGPTPHGSIWWMQRELEEKKKFMPSSKKKKKKK